MSLLIKALDKAQTAKTEQAQADSEKANQTEAKNITEAGLELSLSPTGSALVDRASVADTTPQKVGVADGVKVAEPSSSTVRPVATNSAVSTSTNLNAKSAANVFSAKGVDARSQNKTLAIIAGASLLVLLGMGFYYYQSIANQPHIVTPPAPPAITAQPIITQQAENTNSAAKSESTTSLFVPEEQTQEVNNLETPIKKPAKKMLDNLALADNEAIEEPSNLTEAIEESSQIKSSTGKGKSKKLRFGESIASESASISATSINVSKSSAQASVNPTLMSAYESYNAGKDAEAQKLYKQVLQRDVRNVDALLGLGAIASRQGRVADANGWYSKVLEIEPRNSLAQSALLDNQLETNQSQGNAQDAESRLKNMLAKHPDDANLHIALGNLYAEQNQWPSAQQAYFDAYSLNASADNAFNLAVSLDQMGKPKLAFPYYQRALELMQSGANGIDKAALEARIAAIQ